MQTNVLMDAKDLEKSLSDLARQLIEYFKSPEDLVIIGIRTRGVNLAQRLQKKLSNHFKKPIPSGILDITLYRDDLSQLASQPIVEPTHLPFDVSLKKVILVDDVLFTGRTIRAALDQLVDFGRPVVVRLVVLVDRGWREYPIQPDFVGMKIETSLNQIVQVRLTEIDGEDSVSLVTKEQHS